MNYKSHSTHQGNLVFSIKFWILTIILMILYTGVIFAQYNNTLYFDPTNSGDPGEDGSFEHPYDLFSDVNIISNTQCLVKRGTQMELTNSTSINNRSNVRIGSYGNGEKPIIKMLSPNTPIFHIRNGSDNVVLDSLQLEGLSHESEVGSTIVLINTETSSQNIEDVTINNCEIYNGTKGIESLTIGSLRVERLSILNCEIYNIGLDGILLRSTNDILIKGCQIYDVNMYWHTKGHSAIESYGNGVQITQDSHNWKIYNNIIDRRNTGNKFCFIFGGSVENSGARGEIIGNTFYPAKDTIDDQGGAALFINPNSSQFVKIERNYFCGRADNRGNKTFQGIGSIGADTTLFNYNIVDSISKEGSIQGLPNNCEVAYVNNNTIVSGSAFAMYILGVFPNAYAEVKNNLTAGNTDDTPIYFENVPNVNESNNIQLQTINTALYDDALSIVNWETSNFHRTEDLNDGSDVGILYDFDSVYVNTPPEIGAYEYDEGSLSNTSPTIEVQGFYVLENEEIGEEVGVVVASDPDTNQTLTYTIVSGNAYNTFLIDPVTGLLTINNNKLLNFEINPGFNLTVQVQDNGPGSLIAQATVTVGLINVNEAPKIEDQQFSLEENSANNQEVGSVIASDPDNGQELTYSILSGNTNDAFAINEISGEITVNNSLALNFEEISAFGLTIQVQDNGLGFLTSEALITISLIDVNEAPEIENQSFSLQEVGTYNIYIGTIQAEDPDFEQTLTYSILPGVNDIEHVFEINSLNGNLTLNDNSSINYEENPVYHLTIQVQDNGSGLLTNQAIITVNILDMNEPPEISDQEFTINIDLEADINLNELIYIGTIEAMDPEYGQNVSYSILSGNDRNIFSLIDNTGKLVISDPFALNIQEYFNYSLSIKVVDNSPQQLQATATVNIHVNMAVESMNEKSSEQLLSEDLNENQFSIMVYPNPTSDYFEIDLKNLEPGISTISIFSTNGEKIYQESYQLENGNLTQKINAQDYRNGLYIICIDNNSDIYYHKIVVE